MDSDPQRPALDRSPLRDALVGPGLPWRQLEVVDETGSTNADLLARAAAGVDIDGVALVAEYQRRKEAGTLYGHQPFATLIATKEV